MLNILHRIFVSRYKRKKIFIRRKRVYKKFLGLKTLKSIVYTKSCLPYRQQPVKQKIIKRRTRVKKLVVKRRRRPLKFTMLKLLLPNARKREIFSAQTDIKNFKNIMIEGAEIKKIPEPEEKFQAFIPHAIWIKMTPKERWMHINKRKQIAIKKKFLSSQRPSYAFSNKRLRPILSKLRATRRKQYLKKLVKFARIAINTKRVTHDKRTAEELSLEGVRRVIKISKRVRAKGSVYKKLDYTSLLPVNICSLVP